MPNASLDLDPSFQDLLRSADTTMTHRFNTLLPSYGACQAEGYNRHQLDRRGARFQGVAQVPSCGVWDGVSVSEDNIGSGNRLVESAFVFFFR
jgi:hypothetical protein